MEDNKIIGLFFERDEKALREVSQKYGTYCRTIARNILNNIEDAEECVNETYMRAWESIPPKKPSALYAYLGRITRNLALGRIRFSRRKKRGGGETEFSFDELDEFISGQYSVELETEQKEFVDAINGFLDTLTKRDQQLFVERYWGCCKLAVIAAHHGMSQNGVSENLTRTRQKLKKYLTKRGFEI